VLIDHSERSALWCKGGRMLCRDLRITGCPGTAVLVTSAATAIMERCEVDNTQNFGVYVGESELTMLRCVVHHTDLSSVLARDSARFFVYDSEFHSSKQCGLLVTNSALAEIASCTVHHTAFSGIEVREGASAQIVGCATRHCSQFGVTIAHARATISRSIFEYNIFSGVIARAGGIVDISDSDVSRNKRSGVYFAEGAAGSVINCTIVNNECSGVRSKGTPRIIRNRIVGNAGGIQQFGKEVAVVDSNFESENEIVSPLVCGAIRDGYCTYFATGAVFVAQYWRHCETCGRAD